MPEYPGKTQIQNTVSPQPSPPNALRPFGSWRREIDRLFDEFDRGFWGLPFRRSADFEPRWLTEAALAVDVAEKDKAYEIAAELPGMDQKDIEVKLTDGVLTIKGEKKQESEEKNKNYHLSERRYGAFERAFQVPEGVDKDKIEASFNKGVLTITLPKRPEAQTAPKTIQVKTT